MIHVVIRRHKILLMLFLHLNNRYYIKPSFLSYYDTCCKWYHDRIWNFILAVYARSCFPKMNLEWIKSFYLYQLRFHHKCDIRNHLYLFLDFILFTSLLDVVDLVFKAVTYILLLVYKGLSILAFIDYTLYQARFKNF